MRLIASIINDIKCQFKHGFYAIYFVVTVLYLALMSLIPRESLNYVLPSLIYSDPAALGLFFIGGIVMLEKMQGIINYVVITPLTVREYILSKVISLSILSIIVGLTLSILSGYDQQVNYLILIIGILQTSMLFILVGIMIVVGCRSLNEYFIRMVPFITLLLVPCLSLFEFRFSYIFTAIPSVAAVRIVFGAYNSIGLNKMLLLICYTTLINYLLLLRTEKVFSSQIVYGGQ